MLGEQAHALINGDNGDVISALKTFGKGRILFIGAVLCDKNTAFFKDKYSFPILTEIFLKALNKKGIHELKLDKKTCNIERNSVKTKEYWRFVLTFIVVSLLLELYFKTSLRPD